MARRITWLRVRIVLLVSSAVSGGASFIVCDRSLILDTPPFLILISVAALALFPLGLAMVISLQAGNPCSDKVWTRPSHHSSPLSLGNPLPFFHFAGFLFMAHGAGMVATSVAAGLGPLIHGSLLFYGGLMALLGVRLAMRWCRDKMEPAEQEQPDSPHRAGEAGASQNREQ